MYRGPLRKSLGFFLTSLLIIGICLANPQAARGTAYTHTWTQVNTDGFGDAANWGAVRLYVFGDYIYVASGGDVAHLYRSPNGTNWDVVTGDGFGDAGNEYFSTFISFGGYLYVSSYNEATGAEVWRSSTGASGNWVQVNDDGFGDATNWDVLAMGVFNDYLYAGTTKTAHAAEVWRTADGTTWGQVGVDGFGNDDTTGFRAFGVYGSQLYLGGYNAVDGGKLFRTPDGSSWTEIIDDGFGDAGNVEIISLMGFGGYLYAGTLNGTTGAEIWRSQAGGISTWEQVNVDGFSNANNTWIGMQGAVVNGYVFLGTRNEVSGAELWFTNDGENWDREGTGGFDDANNYALYAMTFKERLYIGFSNGTTGAEIWRSEVLTPLSVTTALLPEATIGTAYNQAIEVTSGTSPYTFTYTGTLPPGLTLSSAGVLYGIPTANTTYSFTVIVTDSGTPVQTASQDFTVTVNPALPDTGVVAGGYSLASVGWLFGLGLSFLLRLLRA